MCETRSVLTLCLLALGIAFQNISARAAEEPVSSVTIEVSPLQRSALGNLDAKGDHDHFASMRDYLIESPLEIFAEIDLTAFTPMVQSMLSEEELPAGADESSIQARQFQMPSQSSSHPDYLVSQVSYNHQATLHVGNMRSPFKTFDSSTDRPSIIPSQQKVRVRLTFYSGQDDQWGDRVAWEKVRRAKKGRTVAADPAVFPYGTWLHIPGFGDMRVEDTGSAVKARVASGGKDPVVDVYVAEEKEVNRLSSILPEYVEVNLLGANR